MKTPAKPARDVTRLLDIMAALRDPASGCPWDVEQTFESIAPYTIEEAYEVLDAIQRGDMIDLKDELGDLLLQTVFHARIAEEAGSFDFGDVVEAICAKLIRRHPHVFGTGRTLPVSEVNAIWDAIKRQEKEERRAARSRAGLNPEKQRFLDEVPYAFPALTRAHKLTAKAAKVGFDWPDTAQVLDKIHEEIEEVKEAAEGGNPDRIEDEIGDLLFAVANLARHLNIDPEAALRRTNAKFVRRFGAVEDGLARDNRTLEEASLDEMEGLWADAKERGL
jgi:ATP diphosphatase